MNRIEKALCELGSTRIPSKLGITETDNRILITLDGEKIQDKNMQVAGNDFEGWVMAVHICSDRLGINKKVRMDLDERKRFQYQSYLGKGHLGRFLYRAMKFSQQYGDWFELSDYLKSEVNKFGTHIRKGVFVNNIGEGVAGSKDKLNDENAVEEKMAEPGVLRSVVKSIDIGNNPVYRQLPVGLFAGDVAKKNMVFTGGKSAIDLWTKNGDEINIVELKTKNAMMGIVSEIFFYANYIYDLIGNTGLFEMTEPPKNKKELRGYDEAFYNRPKKVNGIMLADNMRFHPWVMDGIIDVLNDNKINDLTYYIESYQYDVVIR